MKKIILFLMFLFLFIGFSINSKASEFWDDSDIVQLDPNISTFIDNLYSTYYAYHIVIYDVNINDNT